jgi:hypothetical protein
MIYTTTNNDTNSGSKTAISLTIAERVLEKKHPASCSRESRQKKASEDLLLL